MKRLVLLVFILSAASASQAQERPKLIVGIVVDQMRQEYLYRFNDKLSENGLKKLVREGYMFKNAHFNYVPTYTAPGHASVFTGSTPAFHGIIGNDFYDKTLKREVYCAGDDSEKTVGSQSDKGQMSPRRLLITTIGDEMRLSSQMRSKVVGVSVKDRGAIFPAGHTGEAYWYDKNTGRFITSTYYMDQLPTWVEGFNKRKRADYYLEQVWEPLYDINTYQESINDDNEYEQAFDKATAVFPYTLKKGAYWMVPETPFGNDIVTEMSMAAIENAGLGDDDIADLLTISFSSTDYIGHGFGPASKEVEDTYLRLDQNIAQIINKLDEKIGQGNYTLFLTSDHGVAEVPQYLIDNKVPAGYFDKSKVQGLNEAISRQFGEGEWIENISNNQLFLNRETVAGNGAELRQVQEFAARIFLDFEGVSNSYPAYLINSIDYDAGGTKGLIARGYNQKRSGDVIVVLEPGWMSRSEKGSTHGSPHVYDTHVPVIWYGKHIKKGESVRYHSITDIVPTLSMLLNITLPNGATGQPLEELFEKE